MTILIAMIMMMMMVHDAEFDDVTALDRIGEYSQTFPKTYGANMIITDNVIMQQLHTLDNCHHLLMPG